MNSLVVYGQAYSVIQINGQKIIEPSGNWENVDPKPNSSMEIFANHIPHWMTEVELLPIFASVGPIWKFRLMMNFSGQNRGFGFIQYIYEESYVKAFQILNGLKVNPEFRIDLKISWNICTLIMGNVDVRFNPILVKQNLMSLLICKDVNIMFDKMGKLNFFIFFDTHRSTAMGRRVLLKYLTAFGTDAWVRWGPN